MFKKNLQEIFSPSGAAALPAVIALSMILLLVGLAMTFSGYIQNNIVQNQNKSILALYIADSGLKDAMQKVTRDKDYDTSVVGSYNLAVNGGEASIAITRLGGGQTQIVSSGVFDNITKKLKTVLDVSSEGKVTINSWEELIN